MFDDGVSPDDWAFGTLAEFCSAGGGGVQTGPFGSQLHARDYVVKGRPVVMPTNIGDNVIVEDGIARISEGDVFRLERHVLEPGDIVFSRRGDVERRALVRENNVGWLCGTGCLRIRPGSLFDSAFLSYYLGHDEIRGWIVRNAVGATMANLNTEILGRVPVVLPPIVVQKEIAKILSTLDDRIALLRETNATLEAIAQALFKSWFIDFDPVRAKAEGRSPEGMDEATAALFPDGFEEGGIPLGWSLKPLDEIAHFLNGLALQNFRPQGEPALPVIKIAQMKRGDTSSSDLASSNIDQKYIIDDGDVLFSWSGSLDVVIWCGGKGALNQHLFKVTSSDYPKWFYYLWVRHFLGRFQEIAADKATTMGHIQRRHLSEAFALVPSPLFIRAADEVFSPILGKIVSGLVQISTLTNLRDTLLPRLISGQLRLPQAEALAAEAGL